MPLKILLFTARWCRPCLVLKPLLMELAQEYGLEYREVNVDEDGTLAVRYGVMSVPCITLLRGDEVVDMLHGLNTKAFYRQVIESRLGS